MPRTDSAPDLTNFQALAVPYELRAAKWKNSVSTASVVSRGNGTERRTLRQGRCQSSSTSTAASITPVSISPAGGIRFLLMFAPDDFAYQLPGPDRARGVAAAYCSDCRHH